MELALSNLKMRLIDSKSSELPGALYGKVLVTIGGRSSVGDPLHIRIAGNHDAFCLS